MREPRKKWWYWLGSPSPDGGMIGAYEGGFYTQFGIYRPSENSLMKSLLREFNSVGREEMIRSFYAVARPIDAASPAGGEVARGASAAVTVLPVPLTIRWYLDGQEVPQWRDRASVDLAGVAATARTLTVRVADPTTWVRNTEYRETYLSQSRSWRLVNP
jgi:hypothetical protein